MSRPIVLIPVLLLIATSRLVAQEIQEQNFTRYTTGQGLSHNNITGIAQDSTGFIWLSTMSGLNRYNGSHFEQFHSSYDSNSLPSEGMGGIVWLNNHQLAVPTHHGGVHMIDTRTNEKKNLLIPYEDKQYLYKFNAIVAVTSNEDGHIFAITRSGFYHFDQQYRLVYRFDFYPPEQAATTHFGFGRELVRLNRHHLMIVSSVGIYGYDVQRSIFKRMAPGDWPVLDEFLGYPTPTYEFFEQKTGCMLVITPGSDSLIYINMAERIKTVSRLPFQPSFYEFAWRSKLVPISDTLLYITSHLSGFYKMRLHPRSGHITFFQERNFPSYLCTDLLKDRDNNLWVATNKGLFRQDEARINVQQGTIAENLKLLFPNIIIDDICALGNKLYVGTRGDGGLLVFDRERLQFIRRIPFTVKQKKIPDIPARIYALVPVDEQHLLVGTNEPLFLYNVVTDKITAIPLEKFNEGVDWISDIHKDSKGVIWVSSTNMYRYNPLTRYCSIVPMPGDLFNKIHSPKAITEDRDGNMLLAGHGLCRYNTSLNSVDWLLDSFPYIRIPDKQVNSVTVDGQNTIWINSNNNGLIGYNAATGTFRHFTRDHGLPDNNIASMIVIRNILWMATYSGIACLDLKTFRITSFGKEEGFPDEPILPGPDFFYDSTNNKLYIGFANTVAQFNPDRLLNKSPVPRLFIERIVAGDQNSFLPGESITASWKHDEMMVTIGNINFLNSSSQRFAYRILKNSDTPWQPLGTQSTFSIYNLPPGHHRIQVKLLSLNNRWPEQVKEISVNILPPFWERNWFIVLSAALILLGGYLLLEWRTGLARKKEQEKTNMQELKAEGYKNQFELEQISNYFSSSLAGKKEVEEVLWDVTRKLIARMNYVDCMIYLWNEDKTKMIQKAAFGPKGSPEALSTQVFDVLPGQGVVGYVMQTKEPLLIPDTLKESRYRADEMFRLSEICVPIIHNGELIGIIDSEHPELNYYKERDLKILTTIATLVGNKIKQIESEQSLEVKQKEIATINQQLAEAQLSALQTQMNPHFIFNALNSIKRMILDNQQQKASRYLSRFAHMIRLTVNQSKAIFATLLENTEYLEDYLEMEKLRFDNSFTYQITVDEDIDKDETLIPTLMIQPLAENAIWHGLMPKQGEKKLFIHFSLQADTITCTIEDNGIGIRQAEQVRKLNKRLHQSVGLTNIRHRIRILNEKYDAGCTLAITDQADIDKNKTGTLVLLRFNIITT